MMPCMAHPNRRFTDEQEAEIAQKYRGGTTYEQLTEEYGGCQHTMRMALRRNGIVQKRGGPKRQWTDEEIADIEARWEAGESQHKIARAYSSSQVTISRLLRNLEIIPVPRPQGSGSAHGNWKGGRIVSAQGYVFISVPPNDPLVAMRSSTGYVAEHRLVMARSLGRPLRRNESVHHINSDKQDNRLENLQLRHGPHGKGFVATCASCGSQDINFSDLLTED